MIIKELKFSPIKVLLSVFFLAASTPVHSVDETDIANEDKKHQITRAHVQSERKFVQLERFDLFNSICFGGLAGLLYGGNRALSIIEHNPDIWGMRQAAGLVRRTMCRYRVAGVTTGFAFSSVYECYKTIRTSRAK